MINGFKHAGPMGDPAVPHVLLAEDEYLIRFDLAETLREFGWHVYEVATADEGIALLGKGVSVDLLVSDINMPGETDGVDLAKVIRRVLPAARVVLMSGLTRARDLPEGLCDLFFTKPAFALPTEVFELMKKPARTR